MNVSLLVVKDFDCVGPITGWCGTFEACVHFCELCLHKALIETNNPSLSLWCGFIEDCRRSNAVRHQALLVISMPIVRIHISHELSQCARPETWVLAGCACQAGLLMPTIDFGMSLVETRSGKRLPRLAVFSLYVQFPYSKPRDPLSSRPGWGQKCRMNNHQMGKSMSSLCVGERARSFKNVRRYWPSFQRLVFLSGWNKLRVRTMVPSKKPPTLLQRDYYLRFPAVKEDTT